MGSAELFNELLMDYYQISIIYGSDHALKWLREVLKTDRGVDAVMGLVVESVKLAELGTFGTFPEKNLIGVEEENSNVINLLDHLIKKSDDEVH